jgi:hypothetical protein
MATGDAQQNLIAAVGCGQALPTACARRRHEEDRPVKVGENPRRAGGSPQRGAKSRGRATARLIWILDEFQRIDHCSAKLKRKSTPACVRRSTLALMA